MTNRVKYAKTRKYRDVDFNEPIEKEERSRPKTSVFLKEKEERVRTRRSMLINKKKNIFQRIWDKLKSLNK